MRLIRGLCKTSKRLTAAVLSGGLAAEIWWFYPIQLGRPKRVAAEKVMQRAGHKSHFLRLAPGGSNAAEVDRAHSLMRRPDGACSFLRVALCAPSFSPPIILSGLDCHVHGCVPWRRLFTWCRVSWAGWGGERKHGTITH